MHCVRVALIGMVSTSGVVVIKVVDLTISSKTRVSINKAYLHMQYIVLASNGTESTP